MGSTEKSSSYYVYKGGVESETLIKGQMPLLTYYFEENDGARFLRRGAERSMVVDVSATRSQLEELLKSPELGATLREAVTKILKDNVRQVTYEL